MTLATCELINMRGLHVAHFPYWATQSWLGGHVRVRLPTGELHTTPFTRVIILGWITMIPVT